MTSTLEDWALAWGLPTACIDDLRRRLLVTDDIPSQAPGISEAAVQSRVRVAASRCGMRVWRNNVGAFHDPERGIHVRFGLANDSPQANRVIKSGDLIGIRPRLVQPEDVGRVIGQFVSFECKRSDWVWRGDEHERAQAAWAVLVRSLGGEAKFTTSEHDV